jgi:hypothetical protein
MKDDLRQLVILKSRPIFLDQEDVDLTPAARRRRRARKLFKAIAFIAAPLFIAQSLAFASFIYEESLQVAGFAVRTAIDSGDQAVAAAAMTTFEECILRAQAFQKRIGCLAFWAHDAYHQYFYAAAPQQLLSYYVQGMHAGLWGESPSRWVRMHTPDGLGDRWVDTWAEPGNKLRDFHFDVSVTDNPRHCLRCRDQLAQLTQQRRQTASLRQAAGH